MPARLLCKFGKLKGAEFEIGSEATIGRSESNSIVLEPRSVSSEHARIALDEDGRYVLEDLGSSNGTQLDGRTVRGKHTLGRLHVINFGRSADFVFVVSSPEVGSGAGSERRDEAPREAEDEAGSSTVVDVEPLPLPGSLAAKEADAGSAGRGEAAGSGAERTVVEHDEPALPDGLRDDAPGEEAERGGD